MKPLLLALALCAGCALPVVSAGTFLPAGDLQKGQVQASLSMEAGRVLAGPSDVPSNVVAPEASKWEVLTWVASDASIRWQVLYHLTLEAQLKLTNPIDPFIPALVGGAVGARLRLYDLQGGEGLAFEIGTRFVGVGVEQELTRTQDGRTQTDRWNYRAFGIEVPFIVTYRVSSQLALTGSPFMRVYWIRAWHDATGPAGVEPTTYLQWTPVLAAGVGGSMAMDFGPVEVAPGCALELATRAGVTAPTKLIVEPGVSVAVRF
ncbi:MAG TPA: hypothetical protein VG496_01690 [Myxococcales bacterium]|nr:hypothetical protein [Myxococcales bacterium]